MILPLILGYVNVMCYFSWNLHKQFKNGILLTFNYILTYRRSSHSNKKWKIEISFKILTI